MHAITGRRACDAGERGGREEHEVGFVSQTQVVGRETCAGQRERRCDGEEGGRSAVSLSRRMLVLPWVCALQQELGTGGEGHATSRRTLCPLHECIRKVVPDEERVARRCPASRARGAQRAREAQLGSPGTCLFFTLTLHQLSLCTARPPAHRRSVQICRF